MFGFRGALLNSKLDLFGLDELGNLPTGVVRLLLHD